MIRKATLTDINTLTNYNYNMAKETEGLELDKNRLEEGISAIINDSNKGLYFVYEQDNKVVGQIMVTTEWSDWRNANFWWIQSVYVHKDYRRQGIFQTLYNYVKDLVNQDDSICGLRLYVEKENKNAQSTYQKMGMKETYYNLYEWEK